MDHFQEIGDALGKAITEGDVEKAIQLIKEAVTLDAEFEVYLQPKNKIIQEEVPKKTDPKVQEIYEKLLEMGVDQAKAWDLANSCKSLDDALNNAF